MTVFSHHSSVANKDCNSVVIIHCYGRIFLSKRKRMHCDFSLVCLGLSSHTRSFHSKEDVIVTGKRLQILTFSRHSRPLSSAVFFSVLHLLWYGTSVYDGHLQGPVTGELKAVELPLPVFTIRLSRLVSNIQPSTCVANYLTDRLCNRRGHCGFLWV